LIFEKKLGGVGDGFTAREGTLSTPEGGKTAWGRESGRGKESIEGNRSVGRVFFAVQLSSERTAVENERDLGGQQMDFFGKERKGAK